MTSTREPMVVGLDEAKRSARAAWSAGDYDRVADLFWEVGERIVSRVGVAPGERVLDVACGTGNAAVRAAQAGARVVGLDLAPELFVAGRERALFAGTGVALEFARETVVWRFDSLTRAVETFTATLGPLVKARELLEPQGPWVELRADIEAWFDRWNASGTDAVELPAEYLVVLGQKRISGR